MMVSGVLLIADAALTVVWQEPVTAFATMLRQGALDGELEALQRQPPSRAEREALRGLREVEARVAFRARAFRRRISAGKPIGRIRGPAAGINDVMVEGTGTADLRKGPGHYPKTPLPGLPGTVAIAGHRTTYGAPFNDVDKFRPGDEIEIETPYAKITYEVERTRIVLPSATWVVRRVKYDRLVLTACHPKYSAAKRIVIFAREKKVVERA